MKTKLVLIPLLLTCSHIHSTSMVYNFRIAQITKQFQFDKDEDKHSTLVALFFDQIRKKYNGVHQNFIGSFGSALYDYNSYYIRIDTAFSHITEHQAGISSFCDTQTDDILFSFGKNIVRDEKNLMTFSGLTGIPTHKILRLQHTDFGYGQYSVGAQFDGSYSFFLDYTDILLYGARYIYFIPRKAFDNNHEKHDFTIGNMADLFIANKNIWKSHALEYGYTAKFRFDAWVNPPFDNIVEKTNYIRSNFYIVYRYKFLINDVSNKLLFNFSYGFDHILKRFGNKYILTFWASWNIHF